MSERALIVDPDAVSVASIEESLREFGIDVVRLDRGEGALREVQLRRPDLLLLEMDLPGRSGLDVCRLVRADPSCASTPIVFVTRRASTRDRIAALEAGADDHVAKPFSRRELALRLRALLKRAR